MKYRNTQIFFSILLAISFLTACKPASKSPAASSSWGNEAIVFASDRDGHEDYYRMAPDGSNVQKLSFGTLPSTALKSLPIWSPALQKFVFSASVNTTDADIYSMNQDGSDLKDVTNTPGIYESTPVPSPDGKYIAFVAIDLDLDVFIIKSDGSDRINISNHQARDVDPRWMPDSQHILFSSNRSGSPNIYISDLQGKDMKDISNGTGLDATYSLSTDGKKIAIDSDRSGNMDIFSIDISGENAVNLTKNPARDVEPQWSPDGQWIAFRSDRDGGWHLYVMKADGSQVTRLTKESDSTALGISWTPDSQHLLYSAKIQNQMDVFLVGIDGSQPKNLTNNPANDYAAEWIKFK